LTDFCFANKIFLFFKLLKTAKKYRLKKSLGGEKMEGQMNVTATNEKTDGFEQVLGYEFRTGPWMDPMAPMFIQLRRRSDGSLWVQKRWRKSINDPIRTEIFPAKISRGIVQIIVQEKALRSKLKIDAGKEGINLSDTQIELLIKHLKRHVAMEFGRITFDDLTESLEQPQVFYFQLGPATIFYTLRECRGEKVFSERELDFLQIFLVQENQDEGVVMFEARVKFEVLEF